MRKQTFDRPIVRGDDVGPQEFMAADAEIDLVSRAQSGDESARKQVIINFMPLVTNIAYSSNNTVDYDDQIQNGVLALYHALEKYKLSAGCRFSVYAKSWIRYYNQRYRAQNSSKLVSSLNESLEEYVMDSTDEGSYVNELIEQVETKDIVNTVHECLSELVPKLNERQQKVLVRRLYRERSQSDLAKELGISKQRVHQLEYKLIKRVKELVRVRLLNKGGIVHD